jgi:hypothetical protein
MLSKLGWAAFLASVASVVLLGSAAASTPGGRPIYACFSAQNAAAIGRLGANDASVRYGFETGECLALPAGVPLNDVERHGNMWRFRVFGAKPHLYAADWAAGFQPAEESIPPGFERYLPVTAKLIATGRAFAQCYDDAEKLAERFEAHNRRWRNYAKSGASRIDNTSSPKMVIYIGDTGPRLAAEAEDLRRQAANLENRCRQVATIEADDDFVVFVRTAQMA